MIAINMEMPSCCTECPLLDGEYGTCNIIGETKVDMTEERAKNCPLVAIVTCKDCKYFERLTCLGGQCVCPTNTYINETTNDFFCSDGERRE